MQMKVEKNIQSMESYKRNNHQFLYNLILYSLTSMITFLFFSYPLWLPSITQYLYYFPKSILLGVDAKFFFILVNVIVLILIGESRLTRPRFSEIYDEYVERSHISRATSFNNNFIANEMEEGLIQNSFIRGNFRHEEKTIKEIRISPTSVRQHKPKQSVLRASRSEVELMKTKAHKEKEMKEIRVSNNEIRKNEGNDTKSHHERKLSISKSMHQDDQENLRMFRASKSEVWGESAKVEKVRTKDKKLEQLCMPTEELNTRVEAFIAKVNKQRLLEAKLFRTGRGY